MAKYTHWHYEKVTIHLPELSFVVHGSVAFGFTSLVRGVSVQHTFRPDQ